MKKKTKNIPKYKFGGEIKAGNIGNIATASNNIFKGIVGIDDNSQWGNTLNTAAVGSDIGGAIVPGWGHLIGGGAGFLAGALKQGDVDDSTGDINYGGILGRSKYSLQQESNRIKTSIQDRNTTQHTRYEYYSNPNNSLNTNIYQKVAEGGVVPTTMWYEDDGEYGRTPYGEIYKEPEQGKPKDSNLVQGPAGTQILSDKLKYPGTKDTFAKHYEKSIAKVKNYGNDKYAKNSQLLNDKHAQKQFDEHLAVQEEMKNKKIKKVKNGIPAHEGGKNGTTPDLSDMFLYRQKDGKFVMQDINGNRYDVPEMMLPYIQGDEHGYWFGPQTGVAPSAGKWNGSMNFAKQMLNSKNVAKLRNTMTKVLPKGVKPATPSTVGNGVNAAQVQKESMLNNDKTFQMWQRLGNKGGVPAKTVESNVAAYRDASKTSRNLWELTPAQQAAANASAEQYIYDGMVKSNLPYWLTLAGITGGGGTFLLHEATKDKQPTATNTDKSAVVTAQEKPVEPIVTATETNAENEKKKVVVPKKSSISKPSSGKKTTASRVTTPTVPQEEKVTPEQIAESLRIADIGERHWLRGSVSEPNKSLVGLAQTTPEKLKIQKLAAQPSTSKTIVGSNESTDSNTNWGDLAYKAASIFTPLFDREKAEPVQYHVPTVYNRPTSVNVDPQRRAIEESHAIARYNQANAGMAYGLQAATNRAKQLSDVYSWQTNAQNNLIGQNVDTHNKWSADYANIMNNVYDKTAANRATARNINRQNVATALKNWGQIRRDDKSYELDRMKLQMLDPMLQYGYENYDNYLKWKKENGYG